MNELPLMLVFSQVGRLLVLVAMVGIFAASTMGCTQAAVSFDTVERPDDDTSPPAQPSEPCEQQSCSCAEASSDDDASGHSAAGHLRLLVGLPVSWRDRQAPESHLRGPLFRPPIG